MNVFKNIRSIIIPILFVVGFLTFSMTALTEQVQFGFADAQAFDFVIPVIPTCSFVNPFITIEPGQETSLQWNSHNAVSATINNGINSVLTSGSEPVSPAKDELYIMTVTSSTGHTSSCVASVVVQEPVLPKVCNITISDDVIDSGESVTVSWETSGYDTITVNGVTVDAIGEITYENVIVSTIYELVAQSADGNHNCTQTVDVTCIPPSLECTLQGPLSPIAAGESTVIDWTTLNADNASIDQEVGSIDVSVPGNQTVSPLVTTTYTLTANRGSESIQCPFTVEVIPATPDPVCDLNATDTTIEITGSTDLTWSMVNATAASIDQGIGPVDLNVSGLAVVSPVVTTTYVLSVTGNGKTVECPVTVNVVQDIVLSCDMFAAPLPINASESSVLTWTSAGAVSAVIDQAVGPVLLNDSTIVSPSETTTYTLTVADAANNILECPATVTVIPLTTPLPSCERFTVSPDTYNNGTGGAVTLDWSVLNADTVSIDQGVGVVGLVATTSRTVTDTTTFTLTATGNGQTITCPATVTVNPIVTPTLSCDLFTASITDVVAGTETELRWETTGATSVSINNGVGNVSVDGSQEVTVSEDTLFTLTARDAAGNSVTCDRNITIQTGGGGGGGGSSSPRCDLNISKEKVAIGEKVVLSWRNVRTNDIVLEDNRGNTLVDTNESDEYDEDEDSITVTVNRDTEYTLTASRGSRDRTCRVNVEVDDVVVVEQRSQVAGISLSQVPYTGFEAGPFVTLLFYTVLAVWAAFVAYIMIGRDASLLNFSGATNNTSTEEWEQMVDDLSAIERMDVSEAPQPITPVMASATAAAPANLPTGVAPVFGYQKSDTDENEESPMTELENLAHQHNALLSSDAIQFFMNAYEVAGERMVALQTMIATAKAKFPTEGGWLVLNRERVNQLQPKAVVEKLEASETNVFTPEARVGESSLAEAIVAGNVSAAYAMIGNRPMFAIADAAADLDSVYRARKGMDHTASDMLVKSTESLSTKQLELMIAALTSALDGTYTDEASAVKMAIMKAMKAIA